jgi:hypothetical protein
MLKQRTWAVYLAALAAGLLTGAAGLAGASAASAGRGAASAAAVMSPVGTAPGIPVRRPAETAVLPGHPRL